MEKVWGKIYGISFRAVRILCLALTGLLFVCGFLFTCYADDMESQLVLTRRDFIPTALLPLLLVPLLLFPVLRFFSRDAVPRRRTLLACLLLWYAAAGVILILFGKTVPAADSGSVYSAAEALASGDMSVIHPTDSYLSYYPQQIGLTAYYEIILRLWNLFSVDYPGYHVLKCLNILWAMMILLFQDKITGLLFGDDARNTCLLFSLFNLPLLLYTSFVYGEVPSFALFSMGLWALLSLLKKPRWFYGIVSALSFAGAVALRKNTLILMIAVVLALSFEAMSPRRNAPEPPSDGASPRRLSGRGLLLTLAALYLIVSLSVLPLIQGVYERRAGNRLSSGVPAMSYFAMGMQESSRANGWYNGFNFNTYRETGMDTRATVSISKKAIRERLAVFSENPAYALRFYGGKFLSQWADGTYASRQATLATFGGRREFFDRLYEGDLSPFFISFCNSWQNLLYLGAFFFCCTSVRKENSRGLLVWICLIGVIGGFLFHMIWEGNSRYIFPYGLLLLPYASQGLSLLARRIRKF